ncbi:uncharacterized protein PHALS_15387 [Plasmopara halstedii]|uniref:Uncharacterized protein n=1 Tax=Plasmopara halstedii TaxID=4781 RepID=A0A0P1AEF6_PLAHL|nr:uncharacterized protein PHALS_15387 [Plasmopara halstedii]CEG39441.1 hypothetical protein PHALS_15387 [Plasmopara halstedii]|eukprot:XP_024575810.1 hypothetical protein PHALS_15387 [Plasmopara halstedii]
MRRFMISYLFKLATKRQLWTIAHICCASFGTASTNQSQHVVRRCTQAVAKYVHGDCKLSKRLSTTASFLNHCGRISA